jgi:hypothetical protein
VERAQHRHGQDRDERAAGEEQGSAGDLQGPHQVLEDDPGREQVGAGVGQELARHHPAEPAAAAEVEAADQRRDVGAHAEDGRHDQDGDEQEEQVDEEAVRRPRQAEPPGDRQADVAVDREAGEQAHPASGGRGLPVAQRREAGGTVLRATAPRG